MDFSGGVFDQDFALPHSVAIELLGHAKSNTTNEIRVMDGRTACTRHHTLDDAFLRVANFFFAAAAAAALPLPTNMSDSESIKRTTCIKCDI